MEKLNKKETINNKELGKVMGREKTSHISLPKIKSELPNKQKITKTTFRFRVFCFTGLILHAIKTR